MQTDTCVGDCYYKRDIRYKTPITVIQMLVDIVSKNGNLLLNFPYRRTARSMPKKSVFSAALLNGCR